MVFTSGYLGYVLRLPENLILQRDDGFFFILRNQDIFHRVALIRALPLWMTDYVQCIPIIFAPNIKLLETNGFHSCYPSKLRENLTLLHSAKFLLLQQG